MRQGRKVAHYPVREGSALCTHPARKTHRDKSWPFQKTRPSAVHYQRHIVPITTGQLRWLPSHRPGATQE